MLLLLQSNVYIKIKLQVLTVQKWIPLVRENTALTYVGRQTSPSYVSQYRAQNGNLRKSGSTFRHGTVFAPKQYSYQREATGMKSQKMHSSGQCKNRIYLCWTETTKSHVSQYKAENGNLRKSRSIFHHCTVFAPKQCLYQKEATGMDRQKNTILQSMQKPHFPVWDGKLPHLM